MKNYMRNKNFISEKFYKKREENVDKRMVNIIALILIMNLFCLPISVDKVTEFLKEKANNTVSAQEYKLSLEEEEKKASEKNIEEIKFWIDNIMNENIKEADINNQSGEIIVTNIDVLNKINLDKKIDIKGLSMVDEAYKLEVELK